MQLPEINEYLLKITSWLPDNTMYLLEIIQELPVNFQVITSKSQGNFSFFIANYVASKRSPRVFLVFATVFWRFLKRIAMALLPIPHCYSAISFLKCIRNISLANKFFYSAILNQIFYNLRGWLAISRIICGKFRATSKSKDEIEG